MIMTFPYETYDLINRCDEVASSVAAWSGDGLHFILKDKATFEKLFLTTKYASFIKQLNNYGFTKINSKLEESGQTIPRGEEHFKHINFRRGQRDLCKDVKRAKALPRKPAEQDEYRRENKRLKSDNNRLIDENSRQADEIKRLAEELEHIKEKNRNPSVTCEHQGMNFAIDSRSGNGDGMPSQVAADSMGVPTNDAYYASSFRAVMIPSLSSSLSSTSPPPSSLQRPGMLTIAPETVASSNSTGGENVGQMELDGVGKSLSDDSIGEEENDREMELDENGGYLSDDSTFCRLIDDLGGDLLLTDQSENHQVSSSMESQNVVINGRIENSAGSVADGTSSQSGSLSALIDRIFPQHFRQLL